MVVEGSGVRIALKHKRSHIFGKDQIGLPMARFKKSMDVRWRNDW